MRTRGRPEVKDGSASGPTASSRVDTMTALADELVQRVASVDADLAVAEVAGAGLLADIAVALHIEAALKAGDFAERQRSEAFAVVRAPMCEWCVFRRQPARSQTSYDAAVAAMDSAGVATHCTCSRREALNLS